MNQNNPIELPAQPPRDPLLIAEKIDLKKNLRAYFGFAYFFFLAPLVPIILMFLLAARADLPASWGGVIAMLIFAGAIGFFFYSLGNKRYKARLSALIYGTVCPAQVTKHGRAFVPHRSFRDYVVALTVACPDGSTKQARIQSPKAELHDRLPVGAPTNALFNPATGAVFLPAEIMAEIRFI